MQHLQAYRASIICTMTAAVILVFAGLASAQARSPERLVDGSAEVQITSAPISTVHRYRAAQWLLDMLPDPAPNAENDEFVDGDDTIFLSIFWITYIPIVMLILWLIGDWLIRQFRELRFFFPLLAPEHVPAEARPQARTADLSRSSSRYQSGALQQQAHPHA